MIAHVASSNNCGILTLDYLFAVLDRAKAASDDDLSALISKPIVIDLITKRCFNVSAKPC